MTTLKDYMGQVPAWCPGCGNFAIRRAIGEALIELGLEPWQIIVVSGIGQAAKLPHYIKCNTFNGLHGRALPVATGIRIANNRIPVICETGDGDCYGEGGNHLMHAIRRNVNVNVFVHDNQIYGLTKGQASPTSMAGMVTKVQPNGVIAEMFNPIAMAIALDCSFVARSSCTDAEHLKSMFVQAINHPGFALVDILQPCITFNKLNTWQWYQERVYRIEEDYDPEDKVRAFERSLEWGERIPIGIIYGNKRPILEDTIPNIRQKPLIDQPFDRSRVEEFISEFL
ncbi:MAG: 2-oxoacid ferredoxin oxidoreductase [Candidatus Solincola sediminis]|nr:MAG: 2-oxoacid ferredoxin oxidoreductase [Candidatus Solincola sediminis]